MGLLGDCYGVARGLLEVAIMLLGGARGLLGVARG